MSLPIRETPILRGEDAKKFIKEIRKNESSKNHSKRDKQAFERAKRTYDEIRRKQPNWF